MLPFGLSSAPFIFTKLIKPLEAFWRLQEIPIAIQSSSLLFHRNLSATELLISSTWRELATVKYSLESFDSNLAGHRVRWNTDNQNVVRIVRVGSMLEELQELALDIFLFASGHNIRLDLTWIPRDQNSEADRFSKVVNIDDYSVHDDVFYSFRPSLGSTFYR